MTADTKLPMEEGIVIMVPIFVTKAESYHEHDQSHLTLEIICAKFSDYGDLAGLLQETMHGGTKQLYLAVRA